MLPLHHLIGRLVGVTVAVAGLAGGVVAKIDGPFLGGVAAILTSIFTFVLGLLALLLRGRKDTANDDAAAAWRALAQELLEERRAEPAAAHRRGSDPAER